VPPAGAVADQGAALRAAAGRDDLLAAARFPSDRRAIQEHNTNLALVALRQAGVPLEVGRPSCHLAGRTCPLSMRRLHHTRHCWVPLTHMPHRPRHTAAAPSPYP
jgi:hypothetical protein